jgi:chaperone modulatory protein CbpM
MEKRENTPTVNINIEEHVTYTVIEICGQCGVTREELTAMIAEGVVQPHGESPESWYFPAAAVERIHTAVRLQQDLRINLAGAALALDLLDEVKALRRRVRALENLLK